MKHTIFHSLPELLTYGILVLVLVLNIVAVSVSISISQTTKDLAAQDRASTLQIEKEQNCIGAFFLQQNRTQLTLNNLKVCQPIVQNIEP